MVIGVVALLVGLIGFVSNPIFGVFGVNILQNIVHLAVGGLGVWVGMKGNARGYVQWLGIVSGILGILGFIPGISGILESILGITAATSVLHIVVGAVSLAIVYGLKK